MLGPLIIVMLRRFYGRFSITYRATLRTIYVLSKFPRNFFFIDIGGIHIINIQWVKNAGNQIAQRGPHQESTLESILKGWHNTLDLSLRKVTENFYRVPFFLALEACFVNSNLYVSMACFNTHLWIRPSKLVLEAGNHRLTTLLFRVKLSPEQISPAGSALSMGRAT